MRLPIKEEDTGLLMITKFLERFFSILADTIYRYKVLFFALCLGGSVISFFFARNLVIDPSFKSLLSQDHHIVTTLDEIEEIYGGIGSLVLVIRGNDYSKTARFIEDLVPKLAKHKDIRYVEYKAPIEFI